MVQPKRLKNSEILRIAAEAHRNERTVQAVLHGKGGANSKEAVSAAAKTLGIELPDDVER